MQPYVVEYIKIESSRLVIYKKIENYIRDKNLGNELVTTYENGKVKGHLSENSGKKIKNIISTWLSSVEFYVIKHNLPKTVIKNNIKFITLTLSGKQFTTDEEIKRNMLNRFLITMKRDYEMNLYLWVAETQKNGNLHFHIITNANIYHKNIRKVWNKIQEDNGYLKEFEEKNKHKNPNSTDVHALRRIKNLSAYLTKEMTKGQHSREINGKIWDCSKNLLKLKSPVFTVTPEINDILKELQKEKNYQQFDDEFYSVIFYDKPEIFSLTDYSNNTEINEFYEKIFENLTDDRPK
jgi:hypothetical protein